MSIGDNNQINSLRIATQLGRVDRDLASTYERLSSGLRINNASDDAAGLSLATTLESQSRGARQGIRNINDAISLLNTADAALTALSSIVVRQKELALQATNTIYTSAQRAALDEEADALRDEYNRISQSTTYNGQNVLDGTYASLTIAAGGGNVSVPGANIASGITTVGTPNGTFTFASTNSSGGGSSPIDVATGDLNEDGTIDFVTANFDNSTVGVFIGNGNGTFQTTLTLTSSGFPNSIAVVDLNEDGNLDILARGSSLSVFYGNGNGTFAAQVTQSINGYALLDADDVNGDGNLDLVFDAAGAFSHVLVKLGNGNGTFGADLTFATGGDPVSGTIVDVNNDGKLDIVTANNTANSMAVLLGNGNGTFQAQLTYATGSTPSAVSAADLNGDSIIDLVTADFNSSSLSVFIGNGNGTFQTRYTLSGISGPLDVIASDLNEDGSVDLVAVDRSTASIKVSLGNGNGTFQAMASYATQHPATALILADFNNDGSTDFASANYTGNNVVAYLQQTVITSNPTVLEDELDLTSTSGASAASTYLDTVSTTLQVAQGAVGASLARLEAALSNLTSNAGTLEDARSRILDIDVAEELAKMVRLQVLSDSNSSLAAQANQQWQLVTSLLSDT